MKTLKLKTLAVFAFIGSFLLPVCSQAALTAPTVTDGETETQSLIDTLVANFGILFGMAIAIWTALRLWKLVRSMASSGKTGA